VHATFHHLTIAVNDLDASLRFYREGLGLQIVFDEYLERDWLRFLGSPCTRIRELALAPPPGSGAAAGLSNPQSGTAVALAVFEDGVDRPPLNGPPHGLSHVAFVIPDEAMIARLAGLGYHAASAGLTKVDGVTLHVWFVRDPDGVVIELALPVASD
jgi:catechol 2,3-dioxygenase-like lactoylglutathione lyase family enzyme